jgi:exodeoxyribonuclease V alpha subunit
MIGGIGPIYAKRLVRAYGEAVFELIEQQPERLCEVTGIVPKRAEKIIAGWAEQRVIREIMLFLHSNGVGASRAVRIYETYGSDAVQVISDNPYRLARDIRGIGFRTADQIAAKLGIEKTAMVRVRAGISYALAEAMEEGHCGLPIDDLTALTGKLIEVPGGLIETALGLELEAGEVIADKVGGARCVFLAGLYRAEGAIAERISALACGVAPWQAVDPEKAIPWVERRLSKYEQLLSELDRRVSEVKATGNDPARAVVSESSGETRSVNMLSLAAELDSQERADLGQVNRRSQKPAPTIPMLSRMRNEPRNW